MAVVPCLFETNRPNKLASSKLNCEGPTRQKQVDQPPSLKLAGEPFDSELQFSLGDYRVTTLDVIWLNQLDSLLSTTAAEPGRATRVPPPRRTALSLFD